MDEYTSNHLDKECSDSVDMNINTSVPWYLMAAYSYYVENDPVLSDSRFDRLSRMMLEHWEDIEHQYKERITPSDLRSKTFSGEYPDKIKKGLDSLRGVYYGKKR